MTKLPEQVFVKIIHDGDESFLSAGETPEEMADHDDGPVSVGRYVLVGTGNVNTSTEYVELKSA